jgi:hypothetical protein
MTSMVHSKVDIVLPLQVQHNYFIFQISLWQQKKKKKERNFDNKHRQILWQVLWTLNLIRY